MRFGSLIKLDLLQSLRSQVEPETLVGAMAGVFILGLGAIIFLVMALKMVFPEVEYSWLIIFFTVISLVIMVGIEGVFIWMLLGRKRSAKETDDTERQKSQITNELEPAQARVLPEAMPSVTEHTTRSLEPVGSGDRRE
jgi:heme/copper-type cytochrome/quinol oxidase subunit 2